MRERIRVIGCVLDQNEGEDQSHRLCVGTE